MAEYYSSSSIFALPSYYETMSNAILEAMSCGLPVIVSNISANREIIKERTNGLLVKPGDVKALSHALLYLINNKKQRELMGNNNLRLIKKIYNWDSISDQYISLYKGVLQK